MRRKKSSGIRKELRGSDRVLREVVIFFLLRDSISPSNDNNSGEDQWGGGVVGVAWERVGRG